MKTKLLINLNPLRPPLTGIGYYTKNIVLECLERDIELVGIKNGQVFDRFKIEQLLSSLDSGCSLNRKKLPSVKNKLIDFIRAVPGIYSLKYFLVSLKSRGVLNSLAKQGYVYFEPSFVPMKYRGKTITTIHDLSFLTYPEFHPSERVSFLTKMVRDAVSLSEHVIVDSDSIRQELLDNYSISTESVSTVYLGAEDNFKNYTEEQSKDTLDRLNLSHDEFILSVATLEPRKNLARLVDAYRDLPVELKSRYPLVLVGDSGWKNSSLFESIQDLVDSGNLIVTGYLSDFELKHLYSSAAAFVYPSLYEGFGLPVIEAMSSGTAVLTSNRGATAEVAGDSAILVCPESIDDIRNGLVTVMTDRSLRISLESKAIERSSLFSWTSCVDSLLNIAEKI